MTQVKNEVQQGWEFATKIAGADIAAHLGSGYVGEVEEAIAELTRQIVKLKSNQSDAVLGGYIAEYWHAGTFNVNAVAAGSAHRAWVDEAARQTYGSVDVGTNFGKSYSSKYMATAEKTAVEQSLLSRETGQAKYLGQDRLVPTDHLEGAKATAARRATLNADARPDVAAAYREAGERMTDTVSDGKVSSEALGKQEDLQMAREVKNDEFSAESHGVSAENAIKADYIIHEAVKAGLTTAAITVAIQLAPEIYKTIDYLIKTGKVDIQQIKRMGLKALSAGAEGFLRGSISCSLVIMCRKGLLGEALRNVDPMGVGTVVAVVLETVKNSILVAAGKMTAKQMGAAFVDSVVVSGGYIVGAKIGSAIGGAIGQALGFQLPVVGYLIGSLVGTAFAVVYNIGKKKLISFCVDSGFTCFGLVDQNYELPEEVLRDMGVDLTPVSRTTISRTNVSNTAVATTVGRTNYETIDINIVRRGVIGVNKIGYVI
jgi:hypothetical protein